MGLTLAQWITAGEPDGDVYAMDVARFGAYATRAYTIAKAKEFYARRFQIAYPNEYWPAGRPSKTSPVHAALQTASAVFGVSYGVEIPLYFAGSREQAVETPSLRRSNAFARVREECRAARSSVGLFDISSYGKYLVRGPNCLPALSRILAGRLPAPGRATLTPMLDLSGRLMGDLMTLRIADDEYLITGSGYLQSWHMRWFGRHLAQNGVEIRNVTESHGGIAVFGPRARELLSRITRADVSNAALPFMSVVSMDVALAPAWVARVSLTGELSYEIYVPTAYLPAVLDALLGAAEGLDARLIGMYALNSLRLEKGFGIWSREYSRDYTPRMAGLERFIAYDRPDFIGREAALRDRENPPRHRLVTLAVDAADADASGYEPILLEDRLVGFVTSGGYGHCAGTSLAMGYVDAGTSADQRELTVSIMSQARPCRILTRPSIDPEGIRSRQ